MPRRKSEASGRSASTSVGTCAQGGSRLTEEEAEKARYRLALREARRMREDGMEISSSCYKLCYTPGQKGCSSADFFCGCALFALALSILAFGLMIGWR